MFGRVVVVGGLVARALEAHLVCHLARALQTSAEPEPEPVLGGLRIALRRLVTVLDGHPATLGWLSSVRGHRVDPLRVDRFGQSDSLPDLYRQHGSGVEAILEACGP